MKFVKVEEIPKRKYGGRHNLQDMIGEFVNSDCKIVRIDLNEHDYASLKSCDNSIRGAVKRSGHPVKVVRRDGVLYLKKLMWKTCRV